MDLDCHFAIDQRDVIAESMDGEALIINLNSGAYYSTEGAGDEIWRCLAAGLSIRQIIDRLIGRYQGDKAEITTEVIAFIAELQREQLLLEDDSPAATQNSIDTELIDANSAQATFIKPELFKYTDFAELLRLDPIHEVHELAGWPTPKADQAG